MRHHMKRIFEPARSRSLSPLRRSGHGNSERRVSVGHGSYRPTLFWLAVLFFISAAVAHAAEFHVATNGADSNPGTKRAPFRTIQRAAERAQPGDTVTVHAGIYRERVNPPRGGTSDRNRIVYQAAPGEKVVITGAEPARGWVKVANDTWQLVVPNSFFGNFNPYSDLIRGDWFQSKGRNHHTGAVYLNGDWLTEAANREAVMRPAGSNSLWFATVEAAHTTIWAQFPGVNPNSANVEINVRQTVFYPDQPGRNYITVRGFTLRQAATPWAPPTAEQIGLIGTHWSKGWIIEDNIISHSTCTGITLGKHGDKFDNTSADSAEGYIKTIERAHAHSIPWTKENIGHHLLRNNTIAHCEQAGIVGSLGGSFSTIAGNVIHDIHVRQLFTGDEQAGIKLHGAIDTTISRNHIYRTSRGIWLDWMAQGARVSGNMLHDNNSEEDLFLEVNHGPCVVDHNIFLSRVNVRNVSEGSAFAHNLFAGKIVVQPDRGRATPFHPPHSTTVTGVAVILGGDDRFYNNIFIGDGTAGAESAKAAPQQTPRGAGYGLWVYDRPAAPLQTGGNVLFHGARPYARESNALVLADRNPGVALIQRDGRFLLRADFGTEHGQAVTVPVTTALLGKARISNATYVNPDGSPLKLNTDYFGRKHAGKKPLAGPFADAMNGRQEIEVWPMGLPAAAGAATTTEDGFPSGSSAD